MCDDDVSLGNCRRAEEVGGKDAVTSMLEMWMDSRARRACAGIDGCVVDWWSRRHIIAALF
jgi:hypothetical protein